MRCKGKIKFVSSVIYIWIIKFIGNSMQIVFLEHVHYTDKGKANLYKYKGYKNSLERISKKEDVVTLKFIGR